MNIALHLNESMIMLKENKIEFYRTKLLKLVHIYIIIFIKKKNLGGHYIVVPSNANTCLFIYLFCLCDGHATNTIR